MLLLLVHGADLSRRRSFWFKRMKIHLFLTQEYWSDLFREKEFI